MEKKCLKVGAVLATQRMVELGFPTREVRSFQNTLGGIAKLGAREDPSKLISRVGGRVGKTIKEQIGILEEADHHHVDALVHAAIDYANFPTDSQSFSAYVDAGRAK